MTQGEGQPPRRIDFSLSTGCLSSDIPMSQPAIILRDSAFFGRLQGDYLAGRSVISLICGGLPENSRRSRNRELT